MSGTGFLDDFIEQKGNFEPPTKPKKGKGKGKKKATTAIPTLDPPKDPVVAAPPADDESPTDDEIEQANLERVQYSAPEGLSNANPAIARAITAARNAPVKDTEYVLCGIYGPPKSGKTGSVMASLTPEEVKAGAEIWHDDFDMGGASTRSAHHADKAENIIVLNPWVFDAGQSRETYDFPDTFQNTIDLLKAAVAQAQYQTKHMEQHGKLPKPYLKTVCFDGADQWLHICETLMKIEDLELGRDGIDAAAFLRQREKGDEKKKSVSRFNWNLRAIRYSVALHLLRELCRHGIHCYIITHTKSDYDNTGNEIPGSASPKWLKDTEGHLQQLIATELEEERNEYGELTGVVRAYGTLVAHRTNLSSPKRWLIFERNDEGGEWHGCPGMAEGKFGVDA